MLQNASFKTEDLLPFFFLLFEFEHFFCSKLEKQKEKKRKEEQKRKIACLSFTSDGDAEENEEEEADGKEGVSSVSQLPTLASALLLKYFYASLKNGSAG